MREIKFPNLNEPKPDGPLMNGGASPPFEFRAPKHRYFIVTGNAEHAGAVCMRLEDEGFDIVSVSSFMVLHGQTQAQYSQIAARIGRSAPTTKFETEVDEASKRMIQPAHGNLPTGKR